MVNKLPIIDLIYPRRCPVCQNIVPYRENSLICDSCRCKLPYISGNCCMKCGKPVELEDQEYCYDCQHLQKHFVKGYPLFEYSNEVRQGVLAMKYNNRREYAQFYSQEMLKSFGSEWKQIGFDAILPIPIHKHRRRIRGYNQAELLAYPIGDALDVSVYKKLLLRCSDTRPQKELNDEERLKNIKNAFLFRQNDVELKKVLLVDDIYTTGATIEACTGVLLQGGVEEVYYTSVCIGEGY